jgi:hypothetical protein
VKEERSKIWERQEKEKDCLLFESLSNVFFLKMTADKGGK